jgi:chitinase
MELFRMALNMRNIALLLVFFSGLTRAQAQGSVPTFRMAAGPQAFTLAGGEPARGSTTNIAVLLVPVELSFEAGNTAGKGFDLNASPDVPEILRSPLFSPFAFPSGGVTQFGDAMLRATIAAPDSWHTLFGKPEVEAARVTVPPGFGYVLTSRKSGRSLAILDIAFLQKELFRKIGKREGRLVIAVTRNTAYYTMGDATLCCSWGTHGIDGGTGNSFVIGSFLRAAPSVVQDDDIQPLTQQVAQFLKDPLHDPLGAPARNNSSAGNVFPAWLRPGPQGACGGTSAGSSYFLLEPTDTNPKNNFPASPAFVAKSNGGVYHLQNVALVRWYAGGMEGLGTAYSFPDPAALTEPATPCPARGRRGGGGSGTVPERPAVATAPRSGSRNRHQLIGYWTGYRGARPSLPGSEISPQWDVVLVAFATPDHNAPEGTMQFRIPEGQERDEFKAAVAALKGQGRKVIISLGGGGQVFSLADRKSIPNFVSSMAAILTEYGFDGVDLDFESPSFEIDRGDTDFRNPTTPSVVNMIAALRQLRDRFGPQFLISLVPEGTQIPAGYPSYGGQFGSYLPFAYAFRDTLAFMDVQDYNTPPLQGLDGEIYQAGTVDYHAAMTELVLQGFAVGGDAKRFFPPLPPEKVAVGFLTGDTSPEIVRQAMDYLITGKAPAGVTYKLRNARGYPGMLGAMFWTIDADRRANYGFSNVIGPQLHAFPAW